MTTPGAVDNLNHLIEALEQQCFKDNNAPLKEPREGRKEHLLRYDMKAFTTQSNSSYLNYSPQHAMSSNFESMTESNTGQYHINHKLYSDEATNNSSLYNTNYEKQQEGTQHIIDESGLGLLQTRNEQQKRFRQYEEEIARLHHSLEEAEKTIIQSTRIAELKRKSALLETSRIIEAGSAISMEDVLYKQGISLLGFAGRHLEGRDQQVEQLELELKKLLRIKMIFQEQLTAKNEIIEKLTKQMDEYNLEKQAIKLQQMCKKTEENFRANAAVALNSAQLETLRCKNQILETRFNELEELLNHKDSEINILHKQLQEREYELSNVTKNTHVAMFDCGIKRIHLLEIEKQRKNRENYLLYKLKVLDENREIQIKQLEEKQEILVASLTDALSEKDATIHKLEDTYQNLPNQIAQQERHLQEVRLEKNRLQEKIIELETMLETSGQKQELELAKRREADYKHQLGIINAKCEALQCETQFAQQMRSENIRLAYELSELKLQLNFKKS